MALTIVASGLILAGLLICGLAMAMMALSGRRRAAPADAPAEVEEGEVVEAEEAGEPAPRLRLRFRLPLPKLQERHLAMIAGGLGLVAVIVAVAVLLLRSPSTAYEVKASSGNLELRAYAPMLVVSTHVTGKRDAALMQAYRKLTDYISWANTPQAKRDLETAGSKAPSSARQVAAAGGILMQADAGGWSVSMPIAEGWNEEDLAAPRDSALILETLPARSTVAVRFGGDATDAVVEKRTAELKSYAEGLHLVTTGEPIIALYDTPWTLPALRHNELLLAISK